MLLISLAFACPAAGLAQMDGHGPDAWQVAGVAAGDTLNVRAGPGTEFVAIDALPPDATGLRMITCVPYLTREYYLDLTDRDRDGLPPRWCLVETRDRQASGWVSARYLAEDTTEETAVPPLVAEGVALIRRLYREQQNTERRGSVGPLHPSVAREFLFPDLVARLKQGRLGVSPLFGTQDADIAGLEIHPAPEEAMVRGMVTVHARFRNFGMPQEAIFRLRVDPALADPSLRIMRIEHEGWSFP